MSTTKKKSRKSKSEAAAALLARRKVLEPICAVLDKLRLKAGMKHREVAKSANVSLWTSISWHGKRCPDLQNLLVIAKVYGVPAWRIMRLAGL